MQYPLHSKIPSIGDTLIGWIPATPIFHDGENTIVRDPISQELAPCPVTRDLQLAKQEIAPLHERPVSYE
jgi:hypothetical protein